MWFYFEHPSNAEFVLKRVWIYDSNLTKNVRYKKLIRIGLRNEFAYEFCQ